jgi:anti-sigma28 factor (negative regulator of flagellin synthesis)
MRIDDLSGSAAKVAPSRKPSSEEAAGGAAALPAQPAKDQVQLSQFSKALTDDSRIEHLRFEVESGTYGVEAHQISGKIIDEHLNG